MPTLGYVTATDLGNLLLPMHIRGDALAQTIQDKPWLKWWEQKKKSYSGGNQFQLTERVQGQYMSDTTTLQGFSQDDQLNFGQAMNAQQTSWFGKQHNYGLIITWSELLQDGISIDDKQAIRRHSEKDLYVLADVFKNRMSDFSESYARGKARLFFLDGSQDPKALSGFKSIIQDTATTGTVGGINKAAYPWWQNRANLTLQPSGQDQTLCRFFQSEMRLLMLYGGKPDTAFCGQDFMNALEMEVRAKGVYTQEGFTKNETNDFGQGAISLKGLGKFVWEPMLDQMGESKRCYVLDSRRIKLRPIEDEDDKALTPVRPYNYLVFLHNITWSGAMMASQLNCHGVYSIA
jgi:hypothetical protein